MLFQNILVPVDLSSQSTRAFKVALDISKKYDSKITVITCIEVYASYHLYYQSSTVSQQIKKQSKIIKNHFNELEHFAKNKDVSLKFKILKSDSVVKEIISFTKSKKHDLVVIGSHGRKGFDKLLLGSVANGVSQKANCPVMIVK
ncbi:MAG: universal stress protein [Nitrosopumilus sp.]|jgi:nucleotide-binding universal stress UspA family protein|nr:universal stress protein [Nitrosopumilus sp.]MBT3573845.1 universal stress protein [Nitrosopumilus sp.]MBT3861298.1 universal stress protein [Nitrosopumilus sp.]MBT3956197.1 universal stress protein [Nitrosopumilus sp.]MBT4298589.1 universal stress protein [Nitrosopumilus sp.]